MVSKSKSPTFVVNLSKYIFLGLLAYMPLHIFLSTWLGTSFGVLSLAKGLKDVLLIIGFILALSQSFNKSWFKELIKDRLILVVVAYGALTLLLALIRPTDKAAEIIGVVYNTRFLIFFLYAVLLTKLTDKTKLRRQALIATLASALIVLSFGVIQYTVLPNSALTHVGYTRANGVLPVFYIDEKPDLERIMSTLRDPNSFGSYVIIIGAMALTMLLKKPKQQQLAAGFLALSLLCLWYSFSRSAWLGFIATAITIITLAMTRIKVSKKLLRIGIATTIILTVILITGFISMRNSYFVQNVIFHADQSTVLEDPNQLRIRFWRESVEQVIENPAGGGPGTAGLASIRNNIQGTELNENYYLQIASEVGVIGIILFLIILTMIAIKLFKIYNTDWLAMALLGSFVGLLVTNFLVHIWSNEAVAYTWWGLAGLVMLTSNKRSAIKHK